MASAEAAFPTQAGASGLVVLHVGEGRLDEPGRRAEIGAALERLRTGEHVTLVTDPTARDRRSP